MCPCIPLTPYMLHTCCLPHLPATPPPLHAAHPLTSRSSSEYAGAKWPTALQSYTSPDFAADLMLSFINGSAFYTTKVSNGETAGFDLVQD